MDSFSPSPDGHNLEVVVHNDKTSLLSKVKTSMKKKKDKKKDKKKKKRKGKLQNNNILIGEQSI